MTRAEPRTSATAAFQADTAATAARLSTLEAYMGANVLSPARFCCATQNACFESLGPGVEMAEGQLSHLGHHYDLARDGKPLRIVVVGQEDGGLIGHVSLQARYDRIHRVAGLERHYNREGGQRARNPHMRGTTSALRLIFDKDLGTDWDEEFIQTAAGDRFHIFDAFALINVLLCAAHKPGDATSQATKVMKHNCLKHLVATLEILEPTLLVLQGVGVQTWMAPVLGMMEEITPHLAKANLGGADPLVCLFTHPSARSKAYGWGNRLDAPYLVEVVEPTLRLAMSLQD
jgi:hypothetical protein